MLGTFDSSLFTDVTGLKLPWWEICSGPVPIVRIFASLNNGLYGRVLDAVMIAEVGIALLFSVGAVIAGPRPDGWIANSFAPCVGFLERIRICRRLRRSGIHEIRERIRFQHCVQINHRADDGIRSTADGIRCVVEPLALARRLGTLAFEKTNARDRRRWDNRVRDHDAVELYLGQNLDHVMQVETRRCAV